MFGISERRRSLTWALKILWGKDKFLALPYKIFEKYYFKADYALTSLIICSALATMAVTCG